jgi:multidrug resistance efflux pump
LTELKFEEGDTVEMGHLLAVIDDTAARLAVELKLAEEKEAIINAANDVNLEDARNAEELATAEAEAFKDLRKEGAIPYWEMEKKRLEAKRAQLRIDLAVMQKKIAEVQMIAKRSERQLAEFDLTQRRITTPSTGFIEARIAQLGEWVQPGAPIATLIQMDRLRVEGDIDALSYRSMVRQGTPVKVVIENDVDPDKTIKIDGTLGYVSMEIDLNDRHRVWVEIQNEPIKDDATGKVIDWLIKPGMRASIKIPKSNLAL